MSELDCRTPEWVARQLGLDKDTVYKFLQVLEAAYAKAAST